MTDVTCHEESNPSTPSRHFSKLHKPSFAQRHSEHSISNAFLSILLLSLSAHCDNSQPSDILSQKVCKPRCLSVAPFRHSRQANNRPPSCLGSADISYLHCTQTAPQCPRSPSVFHRLHIHRKTVTVAFSLKKRQAQQMMKSKLRLSCKHSNLSLQVCLQARC